MQHQAFVPKVEAIVVYNSNPASIAPDRQKVLAGLRRNDLFTVVFEQVMSDTALFADVVLPATTFLEGYDVVKAYGPLSLDLARPVIDVVGEARKRVGPKKQRIRPVIDKTPGEHPVPTGPGCSAE